MKILILSDVYPPESFGGADRVAYNQAAGFKKRGHEVFVITTTFNKNYINNEADGVYRIYIPYKDTRWISYLTLYNPLTVGKIRKIIKKIKPDVVHAHNIHIYLSYHSLKIAKNGGAKVFLTAHDAMLFHYGKLFEHINRRDFSIAKTYNYKIGPSQQIWRFKMRYNPWRNIIIKYYLKYVDKIFVVSKALEEALNQNGIKNTMVLPNGIDVGDWEIEPAKVKNFKDKYDLNDKKIVYFSGRLRWKGGDKVIQALAEVTKEVPQAVLLVAGRKDGYAEGMIKMAKENNINLKFTGWISGDELKASYWSSDIVVVPSLYLDPFPTVNLEAMACKKPVVGTCFGGTPEAVKDNLSGYIVNPFNISEMAKKIIYLFKNEREARAMGEFGYQLVKKEFSLEAQIEKTIGLFKIL